MKKINLIILLLITTTIFSKTKPIKLLKQQQNYYLSSTIGNSQFDRYYDDSIILINNVKIAGFTKVDNKIIDYYFYPKTSEEIGKAQVLLDRNKKNRKLKSFGIFKAFNIYKNTKPDYSKKHLHKKMEQIISKHTNISLFIVRFSMLNTQAIHSARIDSNLFQYLRSNGIKSLSDIGEHESILNMIRDKFYMSSMTAFFRDWEDIDDIKMALPRLQQNAKKDNRPIKIKVFACSTGEEVFSIAMELFEYGIYNFKILASDINESTISCAKKMIFPLLSQPEDPFKKEVFEKYFILKSDKTWHPKDPALFKDRVKFIQQDILKNLPDNLEPNFSPPYDIISMMNILNYLKPEAIEKQKNYWYSIIANNGVLIIKDDANIQNIFSLGLFWSLNNFKIINYALNMKKSHKK